MSKKRLFWLAIFFLVFSSAGNAQHYFIGFEPDEAHAPWTDFTPVADSSSPQGKYAGLIRADQTYALNINTALPEELAGTNLNWQLTAFLKSEKPSTGALFVITVMRADTLVLYNGVRCDDFLQHRAQWNKLHYTFNLPANISRDIRLKAYIWNREAAEFLVDSVEIAVHKSPVISFLPDLESVDDDSSVYQTLATGKNFQLQWEALNQWLRLADSSGVPISRPLLWIVELGRKADSTLWRQTQAWKLKKTTGDRQQTRLHFEARIYEMTALLEIVISQKDNHLICEVKTIANKPVTLWRNSLVTSFVDSVHAVIRQSGLLDTKSFQSEYYLRNGGVIFGENERTVMMHNSLQLSSSQLNTQKGQLFLNLDLATDHPLLHYPLIPDTSDYFVDLSAATIQKKQCFSGSFSFFFGLKSNAVPRFLWVPYGYDAAFVWTEHADWTDIATQRAVNFGRSNLVRPADAVGGFIGYGIPVTRSIFYANPDGIRNRQASDGLFTGFHATLTSDSAFANLMLQLYDEGHEICLHTPEQFTSTPAMLRKALKDMQLRFKSVNWIDHGYNNKAENNRENLCCDGLDPQSPVTARRLWKKYGIRYLWNAWYEEVGPWNAFAFDGHFMIPYPGFGDAFPVSMISRHPSFPEAMLWGTTGTLEAPTDEVWDYLFQPKRMDQLIQNRSVYFAHTYPAWVKEGKGYWKSEADGNMVAMDGFNRALKTLQQLREKRLVLPATVQQIVSHYEGLRQIRIAKISDHSLELFNPSNIAIRGMSMAMTGNKVRVNGRETKNQKLSGDDIILWFDLKPQERVTIDW
ncbi:hypothetical protein MASR2M12_17310 [Bacteroidales bacterium]